jgi:hypothetical protein
MGWMDRVRFPATARYYSVFHSAQTGSETHPTSYSMGTERYALEIKRPGREADHQFPSNIEFKNGGAISEIPDTFSWSGA